MDDGFQVKFFGRDKRKAFFQIEAHLMSEHADGARSGTVFFSYSFRTDAVQQIVSCWEMRSLLLWLKHWEKIRLSVFG